MEAIKDESSGFWTGKPWLVINEEGEPAVESFKTEAEAIEFIEQEKDHETLSDHNGKCFKD